MARYAQSNAAITIVTITDDAYSIFTAVMLKSLMLHYRGNAPIELYILGVNVSPAIKRKLARIVEPGPVNIHWTDINDALLVRLGISEVYTKRSVFYYKVLIPYILPDEADKALYIDSDIIIQDDIYNLWLMDVSDVPIAAVYDARVKTAQEGIKNWNELGIDPEAKYFNAGVMLINVAYWRQCDIRHLVLECVKKNTGFLWHEDQYVFNVLFLKRWKELDGRWNQFPEIESRKPFLLHYSGHNAKALGGAIPDLFFQYAGLTCWGRYGSVKNAVRRQEVIRFFKMHMVMFLRFLKLKQ